MRLLDRSAELFVGKDRVGRDARAVDDRLSANLPGDAFNEIALCQSTVMIDSTTSLMYQMVSDKLARLDWRPVTFLIGEQW